MKKSYFLLEIVLTISLIAFLYTFFVPKNKINNLEELTNRISLYLSYVRFKALINDKFDLDSHQFSSHDMIEFAGAIGIKLLELAAENAEILRDDFNYDSQIWETEIVDKQSILNTIKQVE